MPSPGDRGCRRSWQVREGTVNVAPRPAPGLTAIPCRRAIRPAGERWDNPMPRPPWERFNDESAWRNMSKTKRDERGIDPLPAIAHRQHDLRAVAADLRPKLSPPCGVNLTALVSRFHTTCWSRSDRPGARCLATPL